MAGVAERFLQTSGIGAISPHRTQASESCGEHTQQYPSCDSVLHICSCDTNQQHETERIDQHVPFAPRNVFRGIAASYATLFSGLY